MKIMNELQRENYTERLQSIANIKRKSFVEYYLDFILSFIGVMAAMTFTVYKITTFYIKVRMNSHAIDALVFLTIILASITVGLIVDSHYCPYFVRCRKIEMFIKELSSTTTWEECYVLLEKYNKNDTKVLKSVYAIKLEHLMNEARSIAVQECLENEELIAFIPQKENNLIRFIFSKDTNKRILDVSCKFKKSSLATDILRLTNSGLIYEKSC